MPLPSGYTVDDKDEPMPGYEQVPAFLKQGLDMSKVRQVVTTPETDQDRNSTAKENRSDPYKIEVLAPDLYGPPILNHELTHTFQDTRSKDINPAAPVEQSGRRAYDYGGVKGLEEALNKGKTISDFNYEQQAEIVKDYKVRHDQYLRKAAKGKITPAEEKAMFELQSAYHPFIRQLASMPGSDQDLKRNSLLELLGIQKPVAINTKPEAPGLPSFDTPGLGELPADPLMGGSSQRTGKPLSIAQLKEQAARLRPSPSLGVDQPTSTLLRHLRAPTAKAKTTEESEHARQVKPAQPLETALPNWSALRQEVTSQTEPTATDDPGTLTMKRAARGLFGVADFIPQTAGIIHNLFSSDPDVSAQAETDLLNLHPGAQISDRGKEAIEEWKKSPRLAASNVAGDALALFLTRKMEVPEEFKGGAEAAPKEKWIPVIRGTIEGNEELRPYAGQNQTWFIEGHGPSAEAGAMDYAKQTAGASGGGKPKLIKGWVKESSIHPKFEGQPQRMGGTEGDPIAVRDVNENFVSSHPVQIEDILPDSAKSPDRRTNLAQRKRIDQMSIEELRKELLTSDKTGIPNRRAFDDAQHSQASPAVAMSDADGLKALNDKFGYEAGDELLRAKADALKEAGLDAYHEKGDEFLYRGENPEDLKTKLDKAREILRNRVIEVKMKDGTTKRFKGADFSYGTGKDLTESESGLKQHKSAREAAGERARGELRGIVETGPEDGAEHQGTADELNPEPVAVR
jgi:GGDEF domain-containing protein